MSLVGEDCDVPVDWRLLLPECWDGDETRRTKAHVPDHVRHVPRWRHALELVDDLIERWHLPAAPVLIDAAAEADIEPLLAGLESRGLGYIVGVARNTLVRRAAGPTIVGAARSLTASQCVHAATYRGERVTVSWAEGADGSPRQSQFLTVPVPGIGPQGAFGGQGHRAHAQRPRVVIAEWPAGWSRARGHWVTNLAARSTAHVVALAKHRTRTQAALAALHTDFGLGDFEGRSFRGWHHHVTLVSAAAAFPTLTTRAALAQARLAA